MADGRKTGGRVRGTPNRRTVEVAERLEELGLDVLAGLAAIAQDERVDPPVRARVLIELAGFLYPKRRAVDVTLDPILCQAPPNLVVTFLQKPDS